MFSPKLVELRRRLQDIVEFDESTDGASDLSHVEMCLHEIGHVMTLPSGSRNQVLASPFTAHLVSQMLVICEKDHNQGEMTAMAISILIAKEYLTDVEMYDFRVQAEQNLVGNIRVRDKDPDFYLDTMRGMEELATNKARAKYAIRQINKGRAA